MTFINDNHINPFNSVDFSFQIPFASRLASNFSLRFSDKFFACRSNNELEQSLLPPRLLERDGTEEEKKQPKHNKRQLFIRQLV